jgi:hypothetical protein
VKNTTLTAMQLHNSANGAAAAQEYNVALAARGQMTEIDDAYRRLWRDEE